MSRRKFIYLLIAIVLIGAAIIVFLFVNSEDPVEKKFRELSSRPVQTRQLDEEVLKNLKFEDIGEGGLARVGDLSFEQIVALLRKKYGDKIHNGRVQIAMLEELIRYFKLKKPDTWVEYLQEVLAAAFPELAAELFRLSENYYKYNKFLEENKDRLTAMDQDERQQELWELRNSLFGEKANEIWSGELSSQKIFATLQQIQQTKNLSVDEKLNMYRASLKDAYGDTLPSVLKTRQQALINSFVDVIQEDLRAMTPAQRKVVLTEVRQEMGVDDAALGRLSALDELRDQRWSNGELYLAESKQIQSSCTGSDCETKLDALRKRLFGEEAETIVNEEKEGFFRFKNQRRYGRE